LSDCHADLTSNQRSIYHLLTFIIETVPVWFCRLQPTVHASSQTLSISIYFLHDDLNVPEDLLVFAHSIKVVIDLLDLLGLLNDETFLLDDIIFDGLKEKVRRPLPLRSDLIE